MPTKYVAVLIALGMLAALVSAQIDNCCFVDRQCSSDQDWTNGYWAFQNGQCHVPAQPQPQTSAAPVGNVPAQIDNCCGIDRQCSSDQEWTNGYWAFQNGQCAAPAQPQPQTSTAPVPRIEGSSRLVNHITAALKFLKSVAPDWYNYVITGMDSIVEVPAPGWKFEEVCTEVYDPVRKVTTETCVRGGCTARAYYRERKVTLESCWLDNLGRLGVGVPYYDQRTTAAVLAHEACHIHTHEEGKHFATLEDEEAECDKFGMGAGALFSSALPTGLDPSRGTNYYEKDRTLGLLRQYCSGGYRADLFCPTLQRLEDIWRNVP